MLVTGIFFIGMTGTALVASGLPMNTLLNPSDTLDEKPVTVLNEARVTPLWELGVPDEAIIPRHSIELSSQRKLGVVSVVEAIAFHPTVRLSRDALIGISAQIGAMPASSTLILLDGVPITGRTDGRIDLSTFSTLGLDRIEVVTGPMTHFYGSGSSAGVINLITYNLKKVGQFQSSVSSLGEWQNGFRLATPKWGNLYAERQFFDGWDPAPEGKRSRAWDQKTTYNIRHSGQYRMHRWTARHHVSGSWDQIKDRGDQRSPYTAFATDRWIETLRGRLQVDLRHPKWQITAAYDAASRSIMRFNRNLVTQTQILVDEPLNPDLNLYGDGMFRVAHLGSWRGMGTLKWRGIAAYHGQVQYIGAYRMQEPKMSQFQHGILGEFDVKYKLVQLESGVRGQLMNGLHFWNPSLQVTRRMENGQLRVNASGGFRVPELKERYLWFFDASHQIAGNPNLRPEQSQQFSATWISSKRTSLEIQYVELKDAIQLARQSNGVYTYVNLESWSSAHLAGSLPFEKWSVRHVVQAQALWSRLGTGRWQPSPSVGLQSVFPLGPFTATLQHQTQWGLWVWSQTSEGLTTSSQMNTTHNGQLSLQWKKGIWTVVASAHNLWNQETAGTGGHSTGLSGLPLPGRHGRISLNCSWK